MKKILLKLLIAVLSNVLTLLYSYYTGQKNAENKQRKQILQNVAIVNSIRVRLNSDADYVARLRKKFKR